MAKAIFLDRDGTINVDKSYVCRIEDFELIPKTIPAIRKMQELGYIIIIITNQSGIGRGHYSEEDFRILNEHMLKLFSENRITISWVYHCPHCPEGGCGCRKPNTLFIRSAEKELGIDLKRSYVIGDKTSDIEMGRRVGCKTILVETGKSGKDGDYPPRPDFIAKDLYSAAEMISKHESEKT